MHFFSILHVICYDVQRDNRSDVRRKCSLENVQRIEMKLRVVCLFISGLFVNKREK